MRYQFDDFTLDTDLFELSRSGSALPCEPQVIELLAFLVENRDRMVTKDEINQAIWKGRFVSEAALSSRIKSARQLLGDDGKSQRYIRTIHKKGFRFVGQLVDNENIMAPKLIEPNVAKPAISEYQSEIAPRTVRKPSVAVLPFFNLSTDNEQEYLSDGITTDIIAHLSKHRWLQVTARNTSFGYKGKAQDVRKVGRELAVEYVVEGSVQRSGNRVRVIANLAETQSGHQIWADRFNGTMDDIFALQDEITEKIAARVEPEIGLAERNRVFVQRPANMAAWDYYHLGVYHLFQFTGTDNRKSQQLLRQSFECDSRFGEAYAWWAYAVILGMVYWDTPPTQALMDEALAACDTAVALDPQNATFRALKARVLLARCEYDRAITENEIAISLNPTFAAAHCGLADSLAYEGRYEEAIERFERSIALSPNDPQLWAFYTYGALALIFNGEYDKALNWTDTASSIPNCQYWTAAHRMVALSYLNRVDEAKQTAKKLLLENPQFSIEFVREKLFYLKQQEQIDKYIVGLRMAGIPETSVIQESESANG